MGERGKAPRSQRAAGRGLTGGPALPEGKAGRAGCGVVPGGDLVRAVAVAGGGGSRPGCRPAGRAGLPPGTAGIQPPLRPPRQVRPAARRGGGLDTRPAATRRYGPAPARPGGAGPARGPAAGRIPRRGHGDAHRDGARPRRTRARPRAASRYGLARLRAARYSDRRICHRPLPHAFRFSVPLQKSGFWGLFSLGTPKKVLVRQKSAVVAGGSFTSGGPSCTSRVPAVYLAGNDAGQRPDVPGRERPAAGAAGRGHARREGRRYARRRRGRGGIRCRPGRAVRAGRALRGAGGGLRAGAGVAGRVRGGGGVRGRGGGGELVGAGLVGDHLRDTEADELVQGVGDRPG